MTNEPNESIYSDDEVQDSSAGNAVGTTTLEDTQAEIARLKLEIENAHRLAESERKRADDLVGVLGNTAVAQPPKGEPVEPAQAWNKLANELPPEQFEARIAQKVSEEVMKQLQTMGAQHTARQSKRQYFNTKYPELASVSDGVLMAAYQEVCTANPALERYGVEFQTEHIANELKRQGFGGGATTQSRTPTPPKDAPSSPARSSLTVVDDEEKTLTPAQAFKKMLDESKPAYKR